MYTSSLTITILSQIFMTLNNAVWDGEIILSKRGLIPSDKVLENIL